MCLRTLGRVAYTANEDIECYKVLYAMSADQAVDMQRHPDYKPLFAQSPWYSHRYDWGKEYTEEKMPLEVEPTTPTESYATINQSYAIISQGFHSYQKVEYAIDACEKIPWRRGCIVVKCVIPKGARYWRGNDHYVKPESPFGYFEYCSNKIKVVAWRLPKRGEKWTSAEQARREMQFLLPAD